MPVDFHSVNAKFQDTHFLLGMILLYCLYEEKDNCSVRTLYFVLGNEKKPSRSTWLKAIFQTILLGRWVLDEECGSSVLLLTKHRGFALEKQR